MADLSLNCQDFALAVDLQTKLAALRYFESTAVAGLLQDVAGLGLPGTSQALGRGTPSLSVAHPTVAQWILAWRSPTETLVLSSDAAALEMLATRLAGATDAYVVDQSGGIWVLRLTGSRVTDVLVRLGSTTAIPAVGQALTSRLAEITVTAVCVREGEILLLVDRFYADHLLGWIRETIADF